MSFDSDDVNVRKARVFIKLFIMHIDFCDNCEFKFETQSLFFLSISLFISCSSLDASFLDGYFFLTFHFWNYGNSMKENVHCMEILIKCHQLDYKIIHQKRISVYHMPNIESCSSGDMQAVMCTNLSKFCCQFLYSLICFHFCMQVSSMHLIKYLITLRYYSPR